MVRWTQLTGVLVLVGIVAFWAGTALVVLTVETEVAHAHALVERTDPGPGAVVPVDNLPDHVTLWFSEPVSVSFNSVSVLDASNRRVDHLDARVATTDPGRVDVTLGELAQGAYAVRWQATSADNHVVRGNYWFTVGFAAAPPPGALATADAPKVPPLEVIGRALVLASMLALAGAAFFRILIVSRIETGPNAFESAAVVKRRALVVVVAVGALCIGELVWGAAQAESVAGVPMPGAFYAGVPVIVLFGSTFGLLWWTRLAVGLLLAVSLVRNSRLSAVALAVLLILSVSLGGHAVGARTLELLAVTADVVHLTAAAVWLGGLLQVACGLPTIVAVAPGQRSAVLRALVPRLSGVALTSVVVLVITGTFSAWEQVASFQALLQTAYGQSLLLKLGLLTGLLAAAAVNLLYIRPRAASGRNSASAFLQRLFQRVVLAEVLFGAGLIIVVGLLLALPPPGSANLPASIESARQSGDLRISLLVEPNWVGVSRFRVTLSDQGDTSPSDVSNVVLTFAMRGMNMGRTTVFTTPLGGGIYEATGFYVGMPGISQVGVSVSRSSAPDEAAVFQMEVPDISYKQFDGLRASVGLSALGDPTGVADATRGKPIFEEHCTVCHGDTGIGNGSAAASLLPPPSDLTLHARWHPDEQLYWFITNGVTGTAMPAWGDTLTPTERRDVIAYLHELANAPTATPLVAPSLPAPSPVPTSLPLVQPTQGMTSAPTPFQQAAPTSAPASPAAGLTGRLVLGPDTDGDLWVWRFPHDRPEKLTAFGPGESSSNPVWSPDGSEIAFSYYKLPKTGSIPIPDGTDLYLAKSDGTQPHLLTPHDRKGVALQFPVWAPDGKSIYLSYRDLGGTEARVDRVDLESGKRKPVVGGGGYPTISEDGRKLAYVTSPGVQGGTTLMWSGPDGEDPHLILGPGVFQKFYGLRMSPDGQRVLFAAIGAGNNYVAPTSGLLDLFWLLRPAVAYADGEIYDLWTIDLDGRNLRRITTLGEDLPVGAWSPDGRFIGFLGGGSANIAQSGLAVVNADGTQLRRLTAVPGHRGLDWTSTP